MAAAIKTLPGIDLYAPGTYSVRIDTPRNPARYLGVRHNHLPDQSSASSKDKITISRPKGTDDVSLTISSEDESTYEYLARAQAADDLYILLCKGQPKNMEITLERLEQFNFNLVRTSSIEDEAELAEQYPHLPQDDFDEGDLFGDDDESHLESAPDPSNPFDFRNHISDDSNTFPPTVASAKSASVRPTTQPTSTPTTTKRPQTKSISTKKRKAPNSTEKPNLKRVKAGVDDPATTTTTPTTTTSKSRPEIPIVRLDRKASLRRASLAALNDDADADDDVDTGELILENETPVSDRRPPFAGGSRGAMALALAGHLGSGPISLHSAASSPRRGVSPDGERLGGEGGELEGEDEEDGLLLPGVDVEGDEDADVEDMDRLPSPVGGEVVADVEAEDEEDDDLDKALQLAMEEELESEESEEE